MAYKTGKAGNAVPMPSPKSMQDYQAEEDHRTLKRAAEVFADKARMKGVLRQMKVEDKMDDCLESMLSTFRAHSRKHKTDPAHADA